VAVRARAARADDALWDALVVEVCAASGARG
jgi:hypothetical protein